MKHTQEPWEAYVAVFGGQECLSVAHKGIPESERQRAVAVLSPTDSMDEEDIANARRIVACVNFCNGIETEKLEEETEIPGIGLFGKIAARLTIENKALTAQRDDLLDALKDCIYTAENFGVPYAGRDERDRAKVIIKKYDHA